MNNPQSALPPTQSPVADTNKNTGYDQSTTQSMLRAADTYKSMQTPSSSTASAPTAPSYDPFARPGDKYGDSQFRAAQYDSILKEAATGRGITKNQRGAMINAAQGLMAPGQSMIQAQSNDYGQQMGLYKDKMQNGMMGAPSTPVGGTDYLKSIYEMMQKNNGNPATEPAATTPAATTTATTPTATTAPAAATTGTTTSTGTNPVTGGPPITAALPATSAFGNSNGITNGYNDALNTYRSTRQV